MIVSSVLNILKRYWQWNYFITIIYCSGALNDKEISCVSNEIIHCKNEVFYIFTFNENIRLFVYDWIYDRSFVHKVRCIHYIRSNEFFFFFCFFSFSHFKILWLRKQIKHDFPFWYDVYIIMALLLLLLLLSSCISTLLVGRCSGECHSVLILYKNNNNNTEMNTKDKQVFVRNVRAFECVWSHLFIFFLFFIQNPFYITTVSVVPPPPFTIVCVCMWIIIIDWAHGKSYVRLCKIVSVGIAHKAKPSQ